MSSSLPDDLTRTRAMFEQWRATRAGRSKIPDPLWQAAIALQDRYPVGQICRELRLCDSDLRARSRITQSAPQGPTPSFVALPASAFASPAALTSADSPQEEIRLVWERADGTRLHLCLPTSQWAQAESLCMAFLRC
jgi:hypothetical protein